MEETKQFFLQDQCEKHGFDLCHTFHTSWYNDLIENEGHVQSGTLNKLPCPYFVVPPPVDAGLTEEGGEDPLPSSDETARKSNSSNAFLIGNTRTVWPCFIEWLSSGTRLKQQQQRINSAGNEEGNDVMLEKNPFDTFCDEMIHDIVDKLYASFPDDDGTCFDVFLSSGKRYKMIPTEMDSGAGGVTTNTKRTLQVVEELDNFLVSMQRIATLTGSYWYDDVGSKLCVHHIYGTWHAFRAVVIISNENSSASIGYQKITSPPPGMSCPVAQSDIDDCKKMMEYALQISSSSDADHIDADGKNMINGLEISNETKARLMENFALQTVSNKVTLATLGWIGLRDSISLGRDIYRYDKEQLCYHYTRDVGILLKVVLPSVD